MGDPYGMVPGGLYVDTETNAQRWVNENPQNPAAAAIRQQITGVPQARWTAGGDITGWVRSYTSAAAAARQLPVLVMYDIPNRDLGNFAKGGAASISAYLQDLVTLANAIGDAPAAVILEPDALIHAPSLPLPDQGGRFGALNAAVGLLTGLASNTAVYLDAGEAPNHDPATLALALVRAGIAGVRGFSVNVSNFSDLATCHKYAAELIGLLGDQAGIHGVRYVVDTARNGNGRPSDSYIAAHPADWWCNPPGRKLGAHPAIVNDGTGCDALLWIKHPGESDGTVGVVTGVASGTFDPRLATALINGS
ncbi:endoglucanase [Pseudonocardiaceae bacterium YIM PH 21723]|nr:endoglucanase [Pseudonocardiaceae bacterium YIM PH 21723]